jgi:hypothetical protein
MANSYSPLKVTRGSRFKWARGRDGTTAKKALGARTDPINY